MISATDLQHPTSLESVLVAFGASGLNGKNWSVEPFARDHFHICTQQRVAGGQEKQGHKPGKESP
jgi:hypothetical protein